jgi:hypothetical protein
MKPWYAGNARQLLEARRQGKTPDGPVIVSTIGTIPGATALHVNADDPLERLDWRMLVNLEVLVWSDASTPLPRLMALCEQIAKARPRRLVLRFDRSGETHDVEIGSGQHHRALSDTPEQHDFVWCPINSSLTPLADQLTAALVQQHGRLALL